MGVRVLVGLGLGFMWNAAPVDLLGVFLNLLAFFGPTLFCLEKKIHAECFDSWICNKL